MRVVDPRFRFSPRWSVAAVVFAALLLVPRFILLDLRPVIHDESLFSFYAYIFLERGYYTHLPILHGPTLMLAVGSIFDWFGDSIGVARAFIGVCSLVVVAACIGLAPLRYRWWLALLLITSPILLYYSRFMRNELLYNAVMMAGMLGLVRGLSPQRGHRWWAAMGVAAMVALLAIKENVVFIYAAGLTFAAVFWLNRWLSEKPWVRLRAKMTADEKRPVLPTSMRRNLSISSILERAKIATCGAWLAGLLAGALFVTYVYGMTLGPEQQRSAIRAVVGSDVGADFYSEKRALNWLQRARVNARLMGDSWINMKRSWDYWKGQHEQHRIRGALHYYVPIMMLYELPMLVLLYVGLLWDSILSRGRALVYGSALVAWVGIWFLWRVVAAAGAPGWLASVQTFLHIEPNGSMMVLGLMITLILAWSILALRQRRVLAAWLGWWAACSIFQYSVAGEKVPWLAVHIVLPLYLTLVWVWAPRLRRFGRVGHAAALSVVVLAALVALRNDVYLIGERAADPRERLVYNHTTPWFDRIVKNRLALWREEGADPPLDERQIVLIGAAGWPGHWYFRGITYKSGGKADYEQHKDADLIIGEPNNLSELTEADEHEFKIYEGSLRDHWWAPWPDESKWWAPGGTSSGVSVDTPGFFELLSSSAAKLWRYYWWRETWTEPGGYPINVLERK